ncbi:hypothetical protein AX15_004799 [Amanita polypyramis BW_CC]|nr:hypothetical protein AX15_004799 [Amanita polypyramis BW_CC]
MHLLNATLLLSSLLPTLRWPIFRDTFPAYKPYMLLHAPQRTLMVQSLVFTLYLGLGGGIFSSIEGWTYLDGIYWTDYSLLTIGFGSDFLPTSPAAKIVLVPYTAVGIFVIGLVVGSIRALFVTRFRERIVWGKEVVHHQRRRWWRAHCQVENQEKPRRLPTTFWHSKSRRVGDTDVPTSQVPMKWSKGGWETMHHLRQHADARRRYLSLLATFTLFFIIWFGGALLFWLIEVDVLEQAGKFTYPLSLYFTYVSLLTIGYGDVIPRSRAGRPFFVVWSIAAIPTMTLLISDISDTFAKWVQEGPIERVVGRWLIGNVEEEESELSSEEGEEEKEEQVSVLEKRTRTKQFRVLDSSGARIDEVRKAIMLLHEVRKVVHDDEHKRYTWEEWDRWIKLLELDKDRGYEEGDVMNWTWVGDEGPLLADGGSEKLWLLEKFRQKLDDMMGRLLTS